MSRIVLESQFAYVSLLLALMNGCVSTRTTSAGVVGVNRGQTMLVSSTEINRSAEKAYAQILQEARTKNRLNRNPTQLQRVRGIAEQIIPATAVFRPDAPGWRWEVNVIRSTNVNAWCMPGGKIVVSSRLMRKLALTDDELAAVIGHEIAHALREHGREKVSQSAGVDLAAMIGGAIGSFYGLDSKVGKGLIGTAGDLVFTHSNSRSMEQEADRIGIELVARAGYDPHAAITLWQKMARMSKNGSRQWLSTHPSSELRLSDLRNYANLVRPLCKTKRFIRTIDFMHSSFDDRVRLA